MNESVRKLAEQVRDRLLQQAKKRLSQYEYDKAVDLLEIRKRGIAPLMLQPVAAFS